VLNFKIEIESDSLIGGLYNTEVQGLSVLRHGNQPAKLFIIFLSSGDVIQISSVMEPIAEREEVGHIKIARCDKEFLRSLTESSYWNYAEIDVPDWINGKRKIEVLSARCDRFVTDAGLKISASGNDLVLRASSFPCCLEIQFDEAGLEIREEDTEFPREKLVARPLMASAD